MITKRILSKMYLTEKKTLKQIGEHFHTDRQRIYYWKKKYHLRTIRPWERYNVTKLNTKQMEYLLGSLLGDDCLLIRTCNPYLSVTHSNKQIDYLKWKHNIWKKISPQGIKQVKVKLNNKEYIANRFCTIAHPIFINIYNQLYFNKVKKITPSFLEQLTPFSIAIWYMDDGSYDSKRHRVRIATNCFSYEGNKIIQLYFKEKWDISTNISNSDSGTFYIWINTENTIKFFKLIGKYIIPYFKYKINLKKIHVKKRLADQELRYIKDHYNQESPQLIAHKLGRPVDTIFNAAFKLRITQRRGGRKKYEKNLQLTR